MNYTIHQLQIFLKVVETKSITKASEELFMTQPAVSIQLKKFQDQFDIPLTEVISRKLNITEFGLEIASIAERVIQELDEIKYKTEAYRGLLTGKLVVSSASTGKYVFPFFLSGFMEKNPGIDLVLDVTNKEKVIDSLKQNEIDFALVSVLPEEIALNEEKLIENQLYLVGNDLDQKKDKPLIYREKGSATRKVMEGYFVSGMKKHRKQMELTSNEAVKQAVIAGLGNSIMPIIGIHNELKNKELHILEAPGLPIKTEWRLVWLPNKKLSPISEAFLTYVRNEKEQIINKYFAWADQLPQ